MTIYNSNLANKKNRHRGIYEGQNYDVSARLSLPSGTVLTTADDFYMVPVGENQAIKRITLLVLGDTSTIAGEIGYFQLLDKNGDPVVVERNGPSGEASSKFTSPASSTAAFRAAGQLDGYTETIIAAPTKLAGPVMAGIAITTGGTVAADTELFLGVEFFGETGTLEVTDPFPGDNNDYLLDV